MGGGLNMVQWLLGLPTSDRWLSQPFIDAPEVFDVDNIESWRPYGQDILCAANTSNSELLNMFGYTPLEIAFCYESITLDMFIAIYDANPRARFHVYANGLRDVQSWPKLHYMYRRAAVALGGAEGVLNRVIENVQNDNDEACPDDGTLELFRMLLQKVSASVRQRCVSKIAQMRDDSAFLILSEALLLVAQTDGDVREALWQTYVDAGKRNREDTHDDDRPLMYSLLSARLYDYDSSWLSRVKKLPGAVRFSPFYRCEDAAEVHRCPTRSSAIRSHAGSDR